MTSSSRTPLLYIEAPRFDDASLDFSSTFPTPSMSQTLPASTVSPYPSRPERTHISGYSIQPNNRALSEYRKLLAHLLERLQNRPMPPSVFDTFQMSTNGLVDKRFGAVVETVRGVVKFKAGATRTATQTSIAADLAELDIEDEETENTFSTDAAFDLLLQLRELLIVSVTQGCNIFHDSSSVGGNDGKSESFGRLSTPFRRSRSSFASPGKRSRSPSPVPAGQVQAPELLARCISILASIVSEDCRFRILPPRPLKPPNALQALTLDISQFLLHANGRDPQVISLIIAALVPAFYTFGPEMLTRLLTFLEQSVIRGVLEDIKRIQGLDDPFSTFPHDNAMWGSNGTQRIQSPLVSIQIQVAQDDGHVELAQDAPGWQPWLLTTSPAVQNLLSTNAPRQPLFIYYLASTITPLFAAMLETIDLAHPNPRLEALHRFYQLINTIVNSKVDSYLNLLEVIAYHTRKARHSAVSILATFWPKALGHVVVSKPLPIMSFSHLTGKGNELKWFDDHPYTHQFVPWHFHSGSTPMDYHALSSQSCRSCSKSINGFGLLCPFCMSAVHLDCYDYQGGSQMFQYTMVNDSNMQKIAMHRFSYILSSRRDCKPDIISSQRHSFRLVNLFGLSLCFICRLPLWGCTAQGFKCSSCLHVAHAECIANASAATLTSCQSNNFESSHVSIDWSALRSSFVGHYRDGFFSERELQKRTFEEISVFYAVFWIQLQLLINGVAMGSVVVNSKHGNQASDTTEFELHYVVRIYEARLSTGHLTPSPILNEYLQGNCIETSEHHMLFDWSNLVYISTAIKCPYNVEKPMSASSPDLLNVYPSEANPKPSDVNSHSFEIVSLSHMRDALGYEFHIYVDAAARFLLSHLHHLGFFNRTDSGSILFQGKSGHEHVHCSFPLPLGLDPSTGVETLVSAVEACLSDLDLSVNEAGFLLLVRKLFPDGMMSDYASRRLAKSILSWIVAEDDNLAIILRDYVARQQFLPGVRSATEVPSWPPMPEHRPTTSGSTNNGGDYVASRRALLQRYGFIWLSVLHNRNAKQYAETLYDFCTEAAQSGTWTEIMSSKAQTEELQIKAQTEYLDGVIRIITKLVQCGVSFSVFDELLLQWLNAFINSKSTREPIPSLLRLFPEEKLRFSSTVDSTTSIPEAKGMAALDPWHLLLSMASHDIDGLFRSLHCLCVFARSGVDIAVPVFFQFSSFVTKFGASLSDSLLLVDAAFSSTYIKSIGRQDLQAVLSSLHSRLASHVLHCLRTRNDLRQVIRFIRQTLATCLILYGCERNDLHSAGLILEDETTNLPSRRKLNTRDAMLTDPIIIDAQLMTALERYMDANVEDVTCLIAKFFNMFVNDSPYLESHEVDNFILRNGRALCACAWQFYDIQRPDISSIRTSFLLRVLIVDAQPFQALLQDCLKADLEWEARFASVTRLFRIILDVTSPAFNVEERQWRSSVIDVFYYYFSTAWADEKEEIRLAVDSWSQTLLPAHLEAISLCWNESLANAPIVERVKLISFLIQLHSHFPSWKVLSWEGILETLAQDDYERKHGDDEDGPASAHLSMYGLSSSDKAKRKSDPDPDMASLRVSLVLLSLQMIADGIQIDLKSLLRIKLYLVQTIGSREASIMPTRDGHDSHVNFAPIAKIPDTSLPCVGELLNVLDAHHPFDLAPTAMGGPYSYDENPSHLLVGSIFVDVVLIILHNVEGITALPVLTIKNLLESLAIIIQKHDLESRPLKHLQVHFKKALRRTLELLLEDVGYELKQLAMLVIQACTRKWSNFMGNLLFDAVECVAKLVVIQNHQDQDLLVVQGRSYIEKTVTKFSGFFNILCRRPLSPGFFHVLKAITDLNAKNSSAFQESLREALLRDTLNRAVENEHDSFQPVLNNLLKFVEVIYHDNYSYDLIKFVGLCLTMLVRRPLEWADEFDPTPLLLIPAVLIQNNKPYSRELLMYTDNVLRTCLARYHVTTASLLQLLHAATIVPRKAGTNQNSTAHSPYSNIMTAVCEILADGLRVKTRIMASTLTCIIETLTTPDNTGSVVPSPIFQDPSLAYNGVQFLQGHVWSDNNAEHDLVVSIAVAKLVLEVSKRDRFVLSNLLSTEQGAEKLNRQNISMRTWNILALAALSESSDKWISILYEQLPSFSSAFSSSLRVQSQPGLHATEPTTTDINHAYIAIKLWILLARRSSLAESQIDTVTPGPLRIGNVAEIAVWNELWPVFEGLVDRFETDPQTGNLSTLTTLTCSSAANLFLFVRQLCSPLALETSTKTTILSRLRSLTRGESAISKLTRAIHGISEAPTDVSLENLTNQAAKEIMAAEKLQVLENNRRDAGKGFSERRVPERHRREARNPA